MDDNKWFNVQDIIKTSIFKLSNRIEQLEEVINNQNYIIDKIQSQNIDKDKIKLSRNNVLKYDILGK